MRRLLFVAVSALMALAVACLTNAVTASNTVAASNAGTSQRSIGANDLKPSQCAGITLTAIVTGTGDLEGGSASELILGGPAAQQIRGRDGNDCVLGGGGDDYLRGDGGTDVCIGGPGTDTLDDDCETKVQ